MGMNNANLIQAAKRLTETLQTSDDVLMHLIGHPNEEKGLQRLLDDLAADPDEDGDDRWDGLS